MKTYKIGKDGVTANTYLDFRYSDVWYAIWESTVPIDANTRVIHYADTGSSEGSPPPQQRIQQGLPVTILGRGTLKRYGHRFNGWRDSMGDIHQPKSVVTFDKNETLHPNWVKDTSGRFMVTYYSNGGTGDIPPPQIYTSGVSFKLEKTPNNLTLEHHRPCGWNTRADGKGKTFASGGMATLTGETELYAHWLPIPHYIKYEPNDATGGDVPEKNQKVMFPFTDYPVLGRNTLYKTGHVFVGWNTNKHEMGTPYQVGAPAPAASTTLYAIFRKGTPDNMVEYLSGGGMGSVLPQPYTPNVSFSLRMNTFTKDHHIFYRWGTTPFNNLGTTYNQGVSVRFSGGIRPLYALYYPRLYELLYDANGPYTGTLPDPKFHNAATYIAVKTQGDLGSPGMIFKGWNTRKDGYGEWYGYGPGQRQSIILKKEKTTLYAIWDYNMSTTSIYLSQNRWNPLAGEANLPVDVTTGLSWSATSSDQSWLTVSPASGSGRGTITLKVSANTELEKREGKITVSAQGGILETINVTQAAGLSPSSGITVTVVNDAGEPLNRALVHFIHYKPDDRGINMSYYTNERGEVFYPKAPVYPHPTPGVKESDPNNPYNENYPNSTAYGINVTHPDYTGYHGEASKSKIRTDAGQVQTVDIRLRFESSKLRKFEWGDLVDNMSTFPVGSVIGYRAYSDTPYVNRHYGVDFSVPGGRSVKSPFDGTVVSVTENIQDFGFSIVLEYLVPGTDAEYYYVRHLHLQERSPCAKDTTVKKGDEVGKVGGTGGSITYNPHLHTDVARVNMGDTTNKTEVMDIRDFYPYDYMPRWANLNIQE